MLLGLECVAHGPSPKRIHAPPASTTCGRPATPLSAAMRQQTENNCAALPRCLKLGPSSHELSFIGLPIWAFAACLASFLFAAQTLHSADPSEASAPPPPAPPAPATPGPAPTDSLAPATTPAFDFPSQPRPDAIGRHDIPEPLRVWEGWATWSDSQHACPTPYSDPAKHLCFWPSKLALQASQSGAQFKMALTVFDTAWVPLPGGAEAWPESVKVNGAAVAVLEHAGHPAVHLSAGLFDLVGSFGWTHLPQSLPIPAEIGILSLSMDSTGRRAFLG